MLIRLALFLACALLGAFLPSLPSHAQEEALEPVVFIPGILGSRLEDGKGVVWGDALAMVRRFPDLRLSFDEPEKTELRATEILSTVGILGPFKVGQYSGIRKTFKELGFVEGKDLFYFPYDWRQSNFVTAERLRAFIESKKELAGRKITIVAHSMGGLVAHIYLHDHGGARNTTKLVTLGTPHLGSADSVWTLWNGLGQLKDFVLGGEAQVRRTVFSFASMYELLPTYDRCCILGAPGDAARTPTNILDFSNWLKYRWIPGDIDGAAARKFIGGSLARAARLNEIITGPRPKNVRFIKIAGDLFKTYTRVYFDGRSGAPVRWDQFGGDGTVPLVSAAANELGDSDTAIHVHSTIFDDEHVKLKLRRVLTRYNPLDQYAYQAVEGIVEVGPDKEFRKVRAIDISPGESYQQTGGNAVLRARVEDEDGQAIKGVEVKAWLNPAGEPARALVVEQSADGDYVARYTTPAAPGMHKITLEIPGLGTFEDYFVALTR
jgi:pimeloyl-ACP methyl ester carboxylesterase